MFSSISHSSPSASILPFKQQRRSAAEFVLDNSNSGSQLELLFGALNFIQTNNKHWVTWVNPPESHKAFINRSDLNTEALRVVYKDRNRSVFHLLYLALQAANSSWVIGPAQGLSFRETELLEQAARHNGCQLLLIREKSSLH